MRGDKRNRYHRLRRIIGACCFLVFCVSVYMLVSQTVQERKAAKAFEDLLAQIEQEESSEVTAPTEGTEHEPDTPPLMLCPRMRNRRN